MNNKFLDKMKAAMENEDNNVLDTQSFDDMEEQEVPEEITSGLIQDDNVNDKFEEKSEELETQEDSEEVKPRRRKPGPKPRRVVEEQEEIQEEQNEEVDESNDSEEFDMNNIPEVNLDDSDDKDSKEQSFEETVENDGEVNNPDGSYDVLDSSIDSDEDVDVVEADDDKKHSKYVQEKADELLHDLFTPKDFSEVANDILTYVCTKTVSYLLENYKSDIYTEDYTASLFKKYIEDRQITSSNSLFRELMLECLSKDVEDPYLGDKTKIVINYIIESEK